MERQNKLLWSNRTKNITKGRVPKKQNNKTYTLNMQSFSPYKDTQAQGKKRMAR